MSPILSSLCSWKVGTDSYRSDHFPITIEIGVETYHEQKHDYRYKINKLNWSKWSEQLDKYKKEFNAIDYLNMGATDRYKFFLEILDETIISSLPNYKQKNLKLRTERTYKIIN